ncbi:hypothetical protein [Actinoplanes sp. URMC 104]|uniref:hypothetical protein n=1 Tax=Actinoplanes sp. URMC 104 TaxID=3423409 RepID=UPI003F19F65F
MAAAAAAKGKVYSAGTAWLQVVPSFSGAEEAFGDEAAKLGKQLEGTIAKALPEGVAEGLKKADKQTKARAEKSGALYGGTYGRAAVRSLESAFRALPEPKPKMTAWEKEIDKARKGVEKLMGRAGEGTILPHHLTAGIDYWARRLRELQDTATSGAGFFNSRDAADELQKFVDIADEARRRGVEVLAAQEADQLGDKAGQTYGGAFGKSALAQIKSAFEAIPAPKLNMTAWESEFDKIRKELEGLWNGAMAGNLTPEALTKGVEASFRQLEDLQGRATSAVNWHNAETTRREIQSFLDIVDNARRRGVDLTAGHGGSLQDDIREALTKAIEKLPDWQYDPKGAKTARNELAFAREQMASASKARIGIDTDPAYIMQWIADTERALRKTSSDTTVGNEERWVAKDAADSLAELLKKSAPDVAKVYGSAFEKEFATSLERALGSLPKVAIAPNTSAAQTELQRIRREIDDLSGKKIGIDVDADAAFKEFARLHRELRELQNQDVEADVRTNAAAAADGMSKFVGETKKAEQALKDADRQAKLTMSRLGLIIGLSASFGSMAVPSFLSAAAALGTVASMAAAAGSGIGVLVLGFNGIADAVKAMNEADENADQIAKSRTQATNNLRRARENVTEAEANLGRVRRDVAEGAADAARNVADAEKDLAEARRSAAIQARDSAREIRDAQEDVTEAEADAVKVREELNEAYREAGRALDDLRSKVAGNAIDQRKATTEIMKAQEELNKILYNPRATLIEKREAQEAYDERVQQLKDLQREGKQLGQDLAEANRKGIEGSDQVVAAREKIEAADKRVEDAQEKLARTREQAAEQQRRSALQIADAQQRVADAQRAQARQATDGALQIANASKSIRDAREQEAEAVLAVGVAGGEAYRNLQQAMDNLSPAGRRFAEFLFKLKDEAKGLRDAAQENLLPGLQTALEMALPGLPALEGYIGKVAGKLGDLAGQAVRTFQNPTWQRFFSYVDSTVEPSLQRMFDIGANLSEGLASLYLALSPFDSSVGDGLVGITEDFAKWAREVDQSEGYRKFIDYVREQGPEVVELLGDIGIALLHIIEAAMPLGAQMIDLTTRVMEFIDAIPTPALTIFVTALGWAALAVVGLKAVLRGKQFFAEISTIFGPRAQRMIQTYAINTGRATAQTNLFGKATATAGGMAAAAGSKIAGAASTVNQLAIRAGTATANSVLLGRAWNAASSVVSAAGGRIAAMGGQVQQFAVNTAQAAVQSNLFGRAWQRTMQAASWDGTRLQGIVQGIQRMTTGAVQAARQSTVLGTAWQRTVQAMSWEGTRLQGIVQSVQRFATTNVNAVRQSTALGTAWQRTVQAMSWEGTRLQGIVQRVQSLATGATNAARQSTVLGGAWRTASNMLASTGSALQNAGTRIANAARNVQLVDRAVGLAQRSASGLIGVLGGPWGVALLAATTAVAYFGAKAAEQKQKIDQLASALGALNDEFKSLQKDGMSAGDAADEAFRRAVQNNPELQEMVILLDKVGIGYEQMLRAATSGDVSTVTNAIDAQIERLESFIALGQAQRQSVQRVADAQKEVDSLKQLKQGFIENAEAISKQAGAMAILNREAQAKSQIDAYMRLHPNATPAEINAQSAAYESNASRIAELTRLTQLMGTEQGKAAVRADLLRQAIEQQTSAAIGAAEASDAFNSSQVSLRESIASNGRTLSVNTREGLANRDALQQTASASRDLMIAEINSGIEVKKAAAAHKTRIDNLKQEAARAFGAKKTTDQLIDTYGKVPDDVETILKSDEAGFAKVYMELKQLQFIQDALSRGLSVEAAQKEWDRWVGQSQYQRYVPGKPGGAVPKKATGGRITGPGTGTSDDVLMYGSNGEWVHKAAAVRYYGDDVMDDINNMRVPREWFLPGFSTGGKVGGDGASLIPAYASGGKVAQKWPFVVDLKKTLIPSVDEVAAALGGGVPSNSALGGAGGGVGWKWQIAQLRKVFPGLDLYSGYRKNSYTNSGNLSWHSRDGGRAVDVEPRQDVFNYIHDTYGKQTKELIWGGDPNRNIQHGQHHRYSDSLLYQHGPYKGKRGPSPHVHWAFDNGGWLMPGMSPVNMLGQPEPVLTPWQWDAIESFVNQGLAGKGDTYQFTFADTTLTPERLTAIQQRQDALARVGRPR